MQRGVVLFAKNNEKVDYISIATICASFIKKHLNVPVCLITDKPLQNNTLFDIVLDYNFFHQKRRYAIEELSYYNLGKTDAFDLSPFNETLVIDVDYFVQNDLLNLVWNTSHNIHINKNYKHICNLKGESIDKYIGNWGPYTYWATVFYFKKSNTSRIFFNLLKHIEENYDFYKLSYNLPGKIIRNDYIFSIAIELMKLNCPPLPVPTIINSFENDVIVSASDNSITFLCDINQKGKEKEVIVSNSNVHIMNKIDLSNKISIFKDIINV